MTEPNVLQFCISVLSNSVLFFMGLLSPEKLKIEDLQFMSLFIAGTSCFLVGFFLVYNRMTMVANSLSHTTLLGVVGCFFILKTWMGYQHIDHLPINFLMLAALITSAITICVINFLNKRMHQEASNAFSFTALFALGILITSVFLKNAHLGLESVLGDIEAIALSDLKALFYAFLGIVTLVLLFYQRLVIVSFDQIFSKSIQIKADVYKFFLILISSFVLILCFRSLGVILVLNALTAPVLIARQFFDNRKKVFIFGIGVVLVQSLLSIGLAQWFFTSFDLPLSTSGLFGTLGLLFWFLTFCVKNFSFFPKKSLNSKF
jgi:manganese/zinc/iron transport system permease protein